MSGHAHAPDGLDRALSVLKRAAEALFYCTLIAGLVCCILLVAAGFGMLRAIGDVGSSEGHVIVPSVLR